MDLSATITIICSIGGLVFGLLAWVRNQKKDYSEDGESKARLKDLENEVDTLHKKDEKLESDLKERITQLENKFDKEFEHMRSEIKSINKTNNKINIDIAKINTNIDNILKKLEKM